jgi:hypothetical protein
MLLESAKKVFPAGAIVLAPSFIRYANSEEKRSAPEGLTRARELLFKANLAIDHVPWSRDEQATYTT